MRDHYDFSQGEKRPEIAAALKETAELNDLKERLQEFIAEYPGLSAQTIAQALNPENSGQVMPVNAYALEFEKRKIFRTLIDLAQTGHVIAAFQAGEETISWFVTLDQVPPGARRVTLSRPAEGETR